MNIVWLFENDLWKEENEGMKLAVEKLGYSWREVDRMWVFEPGDLDIQKQGEFCIFYGSLNLARRLRPYVAGVYCNLPEFECTKYYPYYEEYLLNSPYIMVPFGSLEHQFSNIFEFFYPGCCSGKDGTELFIRPSSGYKLFTGQTISFDDFERDFQALGYSEVDSHKIVILSYPKSIEKEWRVVIVNGKAITSSEYKVRGRPVSSPTLPEDIEAVHGLAERISEKWSPEPAFCLDIGLDRCDNTLKLIEINSFSCSGLYKCDKLKVVEEVSKLCES